MKKINYIILFIFCFISLLIATEAQININTNIYAFILYFILFILEIISLILFVKRYRKKIPKVFFKIKNYQLAYIHTTYMVIGLILLVISIIYTREESILLKLNLFLSSILVGITRLFEVADEIEYKDVSAYNFYIKNINVTENAVKFINKENLGEIKKEFISNFFFSSDTIIIIMTCGWPSGFAGLSNTTVIINIIIVYVMTLYRRQGITVLIDEKLNNFFEIKAVCIKVEGIATGGSAPRSKESIFIFENENYKLIIGDYFEKDFCQIGDKFRIVLGGISHKIIKVEKVL
ncbi:MAG: hypothetical protein ACRCWM_00075 [Sarcina sp.]